MQFKKIGILIGITLKLFISLGVTDKLTLSSYLKT